MMLDDVGGEAGGKQTGGNGNDICVATGMTV